MRIGLDTLFENPRRATGGLTYLTSLSKALSEQDSGDEIVLFVSAGNRVLFEGLPRVELWEVGWSNENRLRRIATQQLLLDRAAARADCDVLLGAGSSVPLVGGVPSALVLHTLHFLYVPEELGWLRARYRRLMVHRSVVAAKHVLVVSEYLKSELCKLEPQCAGKVSVVPLAVDQSAFGGPPRTADPFEQIRERGAAVILFASTLWAYKNAEVLVRALAQSRTRPRPKLVFAGADWHGETARLHSLGDDLGVGPDLVFLGHINSAIMPSLYQWADLFAYPSRFETFGLPVLEAMAAGLPVLASNATSLPEVCSDAAVLMDPADTSAWARAIDFLLTDEAEAARLRDRGRERAAQMTWTATAEGTMGALRAALA